MDTRMENWEKRRREKIGEKVKLRGKLKRGEIRGKCSEGK